MVMASLRPMQGRGMRPGFPEPDGGSAPPGEPTDERDETHERAQLEADKRAVYEHPLFPLLALLLEKCELATQTPTTVAADTLSADVQAFVQLQQRDRRPLAAGRPEVDELMIKAIQVLRVHLLELEKVQDLCKDFCSRYITCLKGKLQSENLLRSDYDDFLTGSPGDHRSISGAVQRMVNHQVLC
ncbi:homeobox protein PKNOX2-like [Pollicipes pollicipes]|uniref:homeobox protein PKNOX2-like n=1 Tax=Pollicipes pollicipes TaxID=41117 RepID=UPI001884A3E9|nr:homeobox protein PKNOX2-like [Pollicipes pollicipes]